MYHNTKDIEDIDIEDIWFQRSIPLCVLAVFHFVLQGLIILPDDIMYCYESFTVPAPHSTKSKPRTAQKGKSSPKGAVLNGCHEKTNLSNKMIFFLNKTPGSITGEFV